MSNFITKNNKYPPKHCIFESLKTTLPKTYMHDHTKQQLELFNKKFPCYPLQSLDADDCIFKSDIEAFIQQALKSQAEYIRAEMVPKEDEYKDRSQDALGAGENVGFNQCRLIVKWKLDNLINSFE